MFSFVIIAILVIAIVAMSVMLVRADKKISCEADLLQEKLNDAQSRIRELIRLVQVLESKNNELEEKLKTMSTLSFVAINNLTKENKNLWWKIYHQMVEIDVLATEKHSIAKEREELIVLVEEQEQKINELTAELTAKQKAEIFRQFNHIDDYDVVNFDNYL